LEPAAAELRTAGATVELASFDADDATGHAGVLDEVLKGGDIDMALLAFGVLGDQETAERDPAEAVSLLQTNFVGAVSVMLQLAQRMRAQGHGVIVVLSSVAGERVRKSNFVYGASKAGLDGFAQGMGDSLAGSGVRVMVVRPGFVHSKMTAGLDPAPFSTTPEAVADAIVGGLRRDADTVWVPPVLRWVMAAVRHLPRPLFRRLEF